MTRTPGEYLRNMVIKRRWFIGIGVIFLALFGVYIAWRTSCGSTDFDTYYFAAKRVLSGTFLYTEVSTVSPYVYPPFFACIIVPIALLPIGIAAFIWYIINLFLSGISLILCLRMAFGRASAAEIARNYRLFPKYLWVIVVGMLFLDNLTMLQTNIIITASLIATLFFYKKGRDLLAGFFLATAIAIKFIPIIILLYFIVKKESKVVIGTIVWLVALSLVFPILVMGFDSGFGALSFWTNNILLKTASMTPNADTQCAMFSTSNQSLSAFFSRLLTANDYSLVAWKRFSNDYPPFLVNFTAGLTPNAVRILSLAVIICVVALTLLRSYASGKNRLARSLNREYALITVAALIANPIMRFEQFLIILFPFTIAFSMTASDRNNRNIFYWAFITCSILYLAQALDICRLLAFGALSLVCLWAILYAYGRSSGDHVPEI